MNREIRKGDSTKSPIKTTVIPRWPRATPRLHSDEQYQGLNAARGIDFNKQSSSITNSLIKQAMTTSPGIQNCYNILSRSLVFNKNSKIMKCKETGKHEPYTGVKKKKADNRNGLCKGPDVTLSRQILEISYYKCVQRIWKTMIQEIKAWWKYLFKDIIINRNYKEEPNGNSILEKYTNWS